MKKTIFALSLLSAAVGVASAQTNVTVYGIVDMGVVHEFGTAIAPATGKTTKLSSGVQSGSRLGFKGTEDLGGGLSANFQLENGLLADTGGIAQGGVLFGRQAHVGLASKSAGSVSLGRQYAPIFIVLDTVDPFGTGLAGSTTNLMATAVRINNSIKYSTPEFGGFAAELIYGLGEVAGNSSASRQIGLSVGYNAGPFSVNYAHHNANDATDTNKTKLNLLTGTFDMRVVKGHLAFETEKDDALLDARNLMVGVSAPLGSGSVLASYIHKDDREAVNADANQIALGYIYNLSKRTNFYTSVARISNKNGAAYTVGNATEGGTTNRAFNLGVRHRF
jgi:predicted porin